MNAIVYKSIYLLVKEAGLQCLRHGWATERASGL